MKKHIKSANINVMLGLLAVLFISLGYLSMQGREGFKEGLPKPEPEHGCVAPKKWNAMTKKCE